ncbi:MAG: helix-turn-helix transcriptional regulator [Alistipes sp.]|nr:helix-turn-helix transcriptional regulator [Alistipes sp.]
MPFKSVYNESGENTSQRKTDQEPVAELARMAAGSVYDRRHIYPELIFVLGGRMRFMWLGGGELELGMGNFALALPGDFLSMTAVQESAAIICRLKTEEQIYDGVGLSGLAFFLDESKGRKYHLPVNEEMGIFLEGFVPFLRKGFAARNFHDLKVREMLYILSESYNKTDLASFFSPIIGPEIAFKNFVFSTLSKVSSVNELAGMANMSATGFRNKFMRIMGKSPSAMITSHKAEMIRSTLIFTDMPLKEVSEKYGFNSIYVFTRFCKKHLGQSPGSLRKAGRSRKANQ